MGEIVKLADADYRAISDRVSISELNHINVAPAIFKRRIIDGIQDRKKSKALRVGTLFHTALLEPENLIKVVVSSSSDERTTIFKEAEREAKKRNSIVASIEEIDEAKQAAAILMSHPKVKELLRGALVEQCIFWESDGVKCKGKFDAVNRGALIDFKTTISAPGFHQSILEYNYHRQMAFYMDGLNAAGVNVTECYWVVCEKENPFLHKVYKCDKETLQIGRQEYQRLLSIYKQCKTTDTWPGLSLEVETTGLPEWYKQKQTIETRRTL